ncbi:MAG: hypothetical protein WCX96_05180 [Bacilli bacterium]
MDDICKKYYKPFNNVRGLPQDYKDVLIYPLLLKDYETYSKISTYFTLIKNQIPDKDIIKMSMLKFILYIYQPQMNEYLKQNNKEIINISKEIVDIFKLILKPKIGELKDILIEYSLRNPMDDIIATYQDLNLKMKLKIHLIYYFNFEERVITLTENDFDNIREIILEQNGISLEHLNQYDPTLEDSLMFLYKNDDSATFEEQIFSFGEIMKMHPDDVCNKFTFYQFKKYIDRMNLRINYELLMPLEKSGQISLKKGKIEHWLSHIPNKGRYDDLLIKKDDFVKDNDVFKVSKTK